MDTTNDSLTAINDSSETSVHESNLVDTTQGSSIHGALLPVKDSSEGIPTYLAKGWVFLEDINGRGLPDFDKYQGAVPLGRVGPIVFMGHHDPSFPFFEDYDKNLILPCYLSKGAYDKALKAMKEHSEFLAMLFESESNPSHTPMPAHLLEDSVADQEQRIRDVLTWFITNANVEQSMKGVVSSALERDTNIWDSLNGEWRLVLDYVLHRKVFATVDIVGSRIENADEYGLNPSVASSYRVLPFYETAGQLFLLSSDLDNTEVDDFLISRTDKELVKIQAPESSIIAGNTVHQEHHADLEFDDDESFKEAIFTVSDETFTGFEPYSPNVERMQLVHWMMFEAANKGCSDVHIDLHKGACRVRFAIDGELEVFAQFPRDYIQGISSSVKQLAKVDAGSIEHSEGNFTYLANDKLIDIRLGLLVTGSRHNQSPKIVMRLLDRTRGVMDLNDLGLDYEDLSILKTAYTRRFGLILASGGTGHGKSTTLAAIMKTLNSSSRACYSLEDPIEINIDGVAQTSASSKAVDGQKGTGLSFHSGLERLLRMDPDVITVGEIRDKKTAEVTPKAALTGHLVLSTVHTNDAITVISRMLGFGVDPFDLAQSLALSSSQVLVRKLCSCSKTAKLKPKQKEIFENAGVPIESEYLPVPGGCQSCRFTGYRGRRVIMEFMQISMEIQEAIMEQKNPTEIRRIAVAQGYRTIFQKGLELVMRGETSLEEIMKHSTMTNIKKDAEALPSFEREVA
jgi:type II secretory ATPase GspE/PulE/Tfp pilus assembly ATPase PilB-like protein